MKLNQAVKRRLTLPLVSLLVVPLLAWGATPSAAEAQEARARWERMCQIRAEKFDLVLPQAMSENDLDMWIVVMREGLLDPLWEALGRGYVGDWAYYVFTRQGDRAERAALGVGGYRLEECGVYDYFGSASELATFVAERDPGRIGVNMAESIGGADGLSHTSYLHLQETLGRYAERLVSAERFVSDFRATRTAIEIATFAEAGEISREIAERAFSNEVITPGVTTLEDVAWWMSDEQLRRGLGSSFDMPSVYITGPEGIEATSSDRIIQRGDLLMLDWGVGFLDFYTDMKRVAYVLREGETEPPPGIRHAYERALQVRDIMKRTIKPAPTAQAAVDELWAAIVSAGFNRIEFNQPTDDPEVTDVVIGPHSVGNWGHGLGPSLAFFNPTRLTYELRPTTLISIELFAFTANPEWDNAKIRIPLEDDAVVTERGVEWLYPVADRILVIK
ncbi:MAG: M24 family metallopeptidase [Gemmatimonadetes bacterium]|nr:M24 family metallopeptidase [Gemmatimonadota bacterium]NNL31402.1 M24 family metallopeptidase [Gemmatimonadota bacterium]